MKYPKPFIHKPEGGAGTYYFRYYRPDGLKPDGTKKYAHPNLNTGLKDKGAATKYAIQFIKDEMDGKANLPAIITPVVVAEDKGPLLFDRAKKFLERQYADSAPTTIVNAKRYLAYMVLYSPTKFRDELTPEMAADIYHKFKTTSNRHNTVPKPRGCYYFLTICREFWDWERDLGYPRNPFRGSHIQMPKEKSFTICDETWTAEECEAIHNELEGEDKDAFWFMRWTGMYPKDTFMLRDDHVFAKDGLGIVKAREKTKEMITLPIYEAAPEVAGILLERLKVAKAKGGRLFCRGYQDNKNILFVDQFGDHVRAAWERVYPGTRSKMVKSLRHTRTTEWIVAKVEPDVIGNWLGHVDGSKMVLTIYSHRKKLISFKKPS